MVTALAAALVLGISSVADQRSTKRVKPARSGSPRILQDLVRQPLWLIAIGANLVGFALQVVALNFGSLALVQPLLVCDLVFAVLLSRYLAGRRGEHAGRREAELGWPSSRESAPRRSGWPDSSSPGGRRAATRTSNSTS